MNASWPANWDHLLTHIMLHKLDSVTLMHYECQFKDIRESQKLKDFLAYIENRFMALQSAHSKSDNFIITRKIKTKKKHMKRRGICCTSVMLLKSKVCNKELNEHNQNAYA